MQFWAAETRQAHIEVEAIDGHDSHLEILGGLKQVYVVADATDEPRECPPHILVVVDNRQSFVTNPLRVGEAAKWYQISRSALTLGRASRQAALLPLRISPSGRSDAVSSTVSGLRLGRRENALAQVPTPNDFAGRSLFRSAPGFASDDVRNGARTRSRPLADRSRASVHPKVQTKNGPEIVDFRPVL